MPEAHAELMEILRTLEAHYGTCRTPSSRSRRGASSCSRPATPSGRRRRRCGSRWTRSRRACSTARRRSRRSTRDARRAAAPDLRPRRRLRGARERRGASPGAAKGEIVFTADDAVAAGEEGRDVDPRAPVHRGRRRGRLPRRQGHPHEPRAARRATPRSSRAAWASRACPGAARSRSTSRRATRCASTAPCSGGRPDRDRRHHGQRDRRGRAARRARRSTRTSRPCSEWADELRRLGVRANADTPEDARKAREFGAEGIGLCRTEHMFMAADRQPKMRAMIMADRGGARARRSTSCCRSSRRTSRACSRRWRACR